MPLREKSGVRAPAEEIVENIFLNGGWIGVNWTGAWDKPGVEVRAKVVKVNVGRGFEKAVWCWLPKGAMLYIGPFIIDHVPETGSDELFMFYCEEGIYLEGVA